MNRPDREVTDPREISEIVSAADVCRLGLTLGGEPYVVPVSFGYDGSSVYFHSSSTGKKLDAIRENDRICLEFEANVHVRPDADSPCRWSMSYESVICYGRAEEQTGRPEKEHALNQIMLHYSGRAWEFGTAAMEKLSIWKILIESATGKRST